MRAMERGQRQDEADNLDAAIAHAAEHPQLLNDSIRAAQDKLGQWRSQTASEAKLQRALHEGASAQQLSRAIQVRSQRSSQAWVGVSEALFNFFFF